MFSLVFEPAGARAAAAALTAALILSACGGQEDSAAVADPAQSDSAGGSDSAGLLAGTRWQLVEFQSMDDAVGTTTADDPSLYIMELMADGRVAMRLNCNRATGNWSAQPGADGTSGTFAFGPLAMTRALCQQPSLDEQIAGQAEYIRGFLLRDGRLYLSLMADAGIYVWEPVE